MTNDNSQVQQTRRLRWLKIADLKVNPRAQRELRTAWAQKLANEFDPDKIQTPHVSLREDGSKWIMDGQHTIAAMKLVGWGDQSLQCWTYEGLSEASEADMYLALNNRKTQSAFDRFRIAIEAGHADECDIDRIVRACGLHISAQKGAGSVSSVTSLSKVYESGGAKCLGRTLRIIRDAYGDPGLEAPVIHGIGLVCQRYNGDLNDDEATRKLANANGGVGGLTNKAHVLRKQMGGSVPFNVAAAAVEIINSGKGGKKLPGWWKVA